MNTGMGARVKRIAKIVAALCAIELLLPGGTLIVLLYVLTGRSHVRAAGEGERAIGIFRGVLGQIFEKTCDGGSRQSDQNNSLPSSPRTS
jgi:hypothetical protein